MGTQAGVGNRHANPRQKDAMTQSLFALILSVILTIWGLTMIWLTRPAVWARLDAQALEYNPLRGMGWGCLLLGGAALAALVLHPA